MLKSVDLLISIVEYFIFKGDEKQFPSICFECHNESASCKLL